MENELTRLQKLAESFFNFAIDFAPSFLGALLLFFIGWKLTNLLIKILTKRSDKKKIDGTVSHFLIDLLGWTLKIIVIISATALMGVQTATFLTILGTAGLAIGLALQGTLANVAGGLLILMLKPFKVNDLIETQGHTGHVKSMQLFVTEIITFQNEVVTIPNAELSNGRIKNYSALGKIRIDLELGVSYNADLELAKKVLLELIENEASVLKSTPPYVGVNAYADSSINLAIQLWVKPEDYWTAYFDVMNKCKNVLDKAKIEIPFPQRVVHIINEK